MANEKDKELESKLNDLTEERLGIEKEILKLKEKISDQISSEVVDTEKLIKLEALRTDSIEKEEEIRKKIEKIDKESYVRLQETNKLHNSTTGYISDQNDLSGKLSSTVKDISRSVGNINRDHSASSALIQAINGDSAKTLDYIKTQGFAYQTITDSLQSRKLEAEGTLLQQARYINAQTQAGSLAEDLLSTENKLQMAKERGKDGAFKAIDLSDMALDIKVREASLEQERGNMTKDQYNQAKKSLDLIKGRFKDIQSENDALQKQADTIDLISGSIASMGIGAGSLINKFPAGDKINKMMGIDKTANEMKKKFAEAVKSGLNGNFKDAFSQGLGGLKSMISLAPKFLAALGIGLLLSAINFLVGAIGKVDEEAAEIGQEFGIGRKEAFALRDASVDIAGQMKLVGINSKEVVKGIKTTSEIMGGIDIAGQLASGNKQAQQLVKDVTVLSEKFGLSGDEIKNIQSISAMTGKSMGQLTKEATTLGKGIMTAKDSLKVLAKIPPSVTVAFKGGTQELIKAAQKAQALGHDLKKVQDIGDGLMDIESSLTKEMEARVLSGKNINLDLARQYALEGDIAGLQDELLNQAGSLEDFTKMNRLAQKSMAEAMGMSVEEMTEMLTNAQKLKDLGISQEKMTSLQAMNSAQLNAELAKGGSEQYKNYVQQLAKEKESAEIKKRMADILTKVQEKLSKLLTPILEMVHGMLDAAEAGGDFDTIVNSISGIIRGIIPIVKTMFSILGSILGPVTSILSLFGGVEDTTQQVTDSVGKVSDGVGKVTTGVENVTGAVGKTEAGFGSVLKAVGLIGGAFAAKSLIGAGLNMMKEKAIDVGKSILSNIGGSLSKVGGKMGGFAGKALGKLGGGGADKSDALLDKQNAKLEKTDKMAGKASSVGKKIADFGKGLGSAIKSIGKGIGGAFEAILKGLGKGLEGLGQSLGTMTPIGPVVLAVSIFFLALGAALYMAAPAIRAIAPVLMKFAEIIGNVLVKALEIAGPIIQKVIETVGKVLIAFMPVLIKVADVLQNVFITAIKEIAPIIKAVFDGISGVINSVGDNIVKVINAIAGGIVTVIDKLMSLTKLDPVTIGKVADGLLKLGDAIFSFGAGSGIGAGLDALGSLVGGDSPIDQLMKIISSVDPKTIGIVVAGIVGIGTAMKGMADNLGKIDGSKLEQFGDGLSGLVKSIGGSALAEGFGKLMGGEGPIAQIQKLMTSLEPSKMSSISKSLLEVSNSLKILADTINNMNVEKLSEVMEKVSGGGVGSKISNAVGSLVGGITSLFGGGSKESTGSQTANPISVSPTTANAIGTPQSASPIGQGSQNQSPMLSMANVEKKLDTLISVISDATNKPTVIKIGEKTVEEIKSQLDFKKAYNVAVDNSYGRMIQK
jgi:phage-related protein